MAKRFTDTDKWQDEWFSSLPNDYRMVWLYLVDRCSIAGIWKKDFRGLNFNCNTNLTEDEFKKVFSGRVVERQTFYWIPKFLRFQNPQGLNSSKPAVVSIVKELDQNMLIEMVQKLFGNDYLIIIGTGKRTGKGIGEGTGKGSDLEENLKMAFDSITMDRYITHYKGIDVVSELVAFRIKCQGDVATYAHRDSAGLRNAFQYKLDNIKPSANAKPVKILNTLR